MIPIVFWESIDGDLKSEASPAGMVLKVNVIILSHYLAGSEVCLVTNRICVKSCDEIWCSDPLRKWADSDN